MNLKSVREKTNRVVYFMVIGSFFLSSFALLPLESGAVSLQNNANDASGLLEKEMMAEAGKMSLSFVQNRGQFNPAVKYSAPFFAGDFFITENNLTYSFKSGAEKGFAMKEYFLDQDGRAVIFDLSPEDRSETVVSYFKGNDPNKWNSGLSSYNTISLGDLYKKIEVKLKLADKNIEKVFYVNPGGAPGDITSKIRGAESLDLADNGELILKTSLGEFRQTKPVAYQEIRGERKEVEVGYKLKGTNAYGFKVGDYNKKFPLVIDPALSQIISSTYIGGNSADQGNGIEVDSSGNVYVVGEVNSANFPTTVGAYDTSLDSGSGMFISKFNNSLTSLLASTFLEGASSGAKGKTIKINSVGEVLVTGEAYDGSFPTTSGAYDETFNGVNDAFVSKLNSSLTTLLASTFLGGNSSDFGLTLAIGGADSVFVGGQTLSSDFPTTIGSYDTSHNGSGDAYLSLLNSSLTSLSASTFLGGSGNELGIFSMSLTGGDIYVAGMTGSSDFPTTIGAWDTSLDGATDCFISKFPNTINTLSISTYLGGSSNDGAENVAYDNSGSIIISGYTASSDFPATGTTIYDASYNGGGDAFVVMMQGALNNIQSATFLGGSGTEEALSMVWDSSGDRAYIIGYTTSPDFPTTNGAFDTTQSSREAFVSIVTAKINFTSLDGSTFLGGTANELFEGGTGNLIATDGSGNIYVTGHTNSSDFPTTTGAYDTSYNGDNSDVFVSKLSGSKGMKDTLSRLKINTLSNHKVELDLGTSVNWDAGDTLTLTLESDFDLSALSAADATDYDIVANGTEETIVAAGGCLGFDAIEITSIAGQTITFTACGFYTPPGTGSPIIIEIGTNATSGGSGDSQIENPSVSGSYIVRFGGTIGDSNACAVGIVDDDTIIITANVDPTFTFQISSNTCSMGSLNAMGFGTCQYDLYVGTNANSGAIITIQAITPSGEPNAWFNLDTDPTKFLANWVEDSGWPPALPPTPVEAYGIFIASTGPGWVKQGDFSDDGAPIPDTVTPVLSIAAPVDISVRAGRSTHFAVIEADSPAGTYSQTVQYIATGRF